MNKNALWIVIALIAAVAVVAAVAMQPKAEPEPAADAVTQSGTATEVDAEILTDWVGPKTHLFTVTGSNYKFAPATMTVKKGDTVRITLIGEGWNHDLRIDEFNAKTKVIKAGEQDTIEFVADKAGTFEYYCSVGNHRSMGMAGTLTVTP